MSEWTMEHVALKRLPLRAAAWVIVLTAGCFQTNPRTGGESHFLRACDGSCAAGLSCICGLCTKSCAAHASCQALTSATSCVAPTSNAGSCESGGASGLICDVTCTTGSQCAALGAGFECSAGRCRQASSTSSGSPQTATKAATKAPVAGLCASGTDGGSCGVAPTSDGGVQSSQPLAMLLVDTSGSQERKWGCTCTSPGCDECMPDCAKGERNRWIGTLEALTGTFRGYGCHTLDRTAQNGATYDLGYYLPHVAPDSSGQTADGALDLYAQRLRFGMATFDGWDTYVGTAPLVSVADFDFARSETVDGLWSYNPERALQMMLPRPDGSRIGTFAYPAVTDPYYMDTGIRGPQATEGGLLVAGSDADALRVNAQVQADLLRVRPYGGTPIAAAFDDLYYYLSGDPSMQRAQAGAQRRNLVLITDGYPDDDYRSFGCDCASTQNPSDPSYCGGPPNDPSMMHCPYPTVEQTAHTLRCGLGQACDSGVVERVYIVAFAVDDPKVSAKLDAIAQEGGTMAAHLAADPEGLRSELQTIFEEIARPQ
jgi:hypothetical protein